MMTSHKSTTCKLLYCRQEATTGNSVLKGTESLTYVESMNITVGDIQRSVHFLLVAFPHWTMRARGQYEWQNMAVYWVHVGDGSCNLALQSPAIEVYNPQDMSEHNTCLGFAVNSLPTLKSRLALGGYSIEYQVERAANQGMRVFYRDENNISYEFVEYATSDVLTPVV
ncbi:VOC family protein [Zooshikella sp. RANM57]|uniref:VOC family protein n=1 Tax=Zooshikella sp. RANM57 TaxID=3425863 RepID=UPI003D6F20DD